MRHGQGVHNHTQLYDEVDPRLTELGYFQATALQTHPLLASPDVVVVSPLTRAIQTALAIFEEEVSCKTRFILLPLMTERWGAPCDEGRPPGALVADFPAIRGWTGFEDLAQNWWPTASTDTNWRSERVPVFRRWLERRPEKHIVCVGHGVLFKALVPDRNWSNCEVVELLR